MVSVLEMIEHPIEVVSMFQNGIEVLSVFQNGIPLMVLLGPPIKPHATRPPPPPFDTWGYMDVERSCGHGPEPMAHGAMAQGPRPMEP